MMWRASAARPYLPGISDEDDAFSEASTDSAERRGPDYNPDATWKECPYEEMASGDEVGGTAPSAYSCFLVS
jgi:hypothetical protein